jgi:hypothetical protein
MAGWYIRRDEKIIGPVEFSKLQELVASGRLLPTDQLAKDIAGPWTAAARTSLFAKPQQAADGVSAPQSPQTTLIPKSAQIPIPAGSQENAKIPGRVKKSVFGAHVVVYDCPRCLTKLKSPLEDAGKSETCPQCGHAFVVPGADEREWIRTEVAAKAEAKRKAKEEQRELRTEAEGIGVGAMGETGSRRSPRSSTPSERSRTAGSSDPSLPILWRRNICCRKKV